MEAHGHGFYVLGRDVGDGSGFFIPGVCSSVGIAASLSMRVSGRLPMIAPWAAS